MPPGDTIFALSSGALPAAIAVVRVSGPAAGEALRRLAGMLPPPRVAKLTALRGEDGALLDRALVLWMPAPATSTGEDMAELHLHGGRAVTSALSIALAAMPGVRAADAGEFTRRAFANGKLDLAQAEGLADLLAAETEAQRRQSLRLVEGGLGRLIEGWRQALLGLSAQVEAAIEFGEDEDDVPTFGEFHLATLDCLIADIENALAAPPAERLRDGIRVVIAGPPNAGKSSLINALSGREAAIATPIPGTTRDLVEVPVALGGFPLVLIDSAGLRDSTDPVERIGVDRARHAIGTADLVLWLGEPNARPAASKVLAVHAQADRLGRELPPAGADVAISVVTGKGMAQLEALLLGECRALTPAPDRAAINERQRNSLRAALRSLMACQRAADPILVAEELRLARLSLDRITGRAGTEEMLDALFGRFCIGK